MTQLKLCHDLGAPRIILANQLIGRAEIHGLARLTASAPDRPCYVLVDSAESVKAISEGFSQVPIAPAARLLVEIGMQDGRCGVRTLHEGLALARLIHALPQVELHGVEGYEGLIFSERSVQDSVEIEGYLGSLLDLHHRLRADGLYADPTQVILTASGSAYYDLVAQALAGRTPGATLVLRSGCYVTHDSGFYRELLARMDARQAVGPPTRLQPALEVWTRMISRPQSDQAIVMMGKRDVSHDIHLPMARYWFREGLHTAPNLVEGLVVEKLSDQHGFVTVPPGADLAAGDLLGFEISHPCTTFDKWSVLMEVDDDYTVVGGLKTFFILLKGGPVIDGGGAPAYAADVAIRGDTIVAVGSSLKVRANHVFDVSGLVVSPGFIDVHPHDDLICITQPDVIPKISQGVTTVVVGNCGISAPLLRFDDAVAEPFNLLGAREDFAYETFGDYRRAIEAATPRVNVAALVGHSALRVLCLKDLERPATPGERDSMNVLLQDALDHGAVGLSSGVFYAPAWAADGPWADQPGGGGAKDDRPGCRNLPSRRPGTHRARHESGHHGFRRRDDP